jgi:hypothetical protein
MREFSDGRIFGDNWIEIVIRVAEDKTNSFNDTPISSNHNYKNAEMVRVNINKKSYDVTLAVWFIDFSNNKLRPRKGTVGIDRPIL